MTAAGPPVWVGRPPAYLTGLVGREDDAARVRELVLDPATRLITLTGPGGVGKTRLAVQVATDLDSGFAEVAFVDFAPVRDPERVPDRIAAALRVEDPLDLGERRLLLVLDNVEHVLAAGPALVELLAGCPGLTLLVTSRAVLRVSGEHVVTVPPLALPDPEQSRAALTGNDAVRLFVERSAAVSQGFALTDANAAAVARVCRALDGLPLAIELAAARMTVLSPEALLTRLDRRLAVLTGGSRDGPERHRTLRAGLAWSHDLLGPAEQQLFRRLAVFSGGFGLAAAEALGGRLDTLSALVDRSLVQRVPQDEPRFALLETVAEFALERLLAAGEEAAARDAHAAHFRALAAAAEPELRGPDQQVWRDRLEADLDNLRAALTRSTGPDGLRLAGALWYFWFQRGLPGEGRRWLARALADPGESGVDRAQALLGAGTLAWRQGDFAAARQHLDESVRLWRATGDDRGLAEALHVLGHVEFDQRDLRAAQVLFEDSLAAYRSTEDTLGGLPLLADLGLVAYHRGDYARATRIHEESLAEFRRHGLKDRVAGALNVLGDLARIAGEQERAATLYAESLDLFRELRGTPGIASALHKLGQVARATGDRAKARSFYRQSLALQRDLGNAQGIAECLAGLAGTVPRPADAARVLGAAEALLAELGVPLAPADQAVLDRDRKALRRTLGPQWSEPAGLDEAIELALADEPAPPVRAETALSPREREVAALIARGLTNKEISAALVIAEKTVGSHVEHIMTKLGLRSRTRVAVWAIERGIGNSPDAAAERRS